MVNGQRTVTIAGAGPAGLAAAITVAHSGGRAIVYERRADVGGRFHGDFQGIENWTTRGDAIDELSALGIRRTFACTPFRFATFFDPPGRRYRFSSPEPIWYLVRRGPSPGTLDQAMKCQALEAGVEFRFGQTAPARPAPDIVAGGPRRADLIAAGYLFETDWPDGAYIVLSDALSPKGYAYLLCCGGQGTVCTCQFADFSRARAYLERTVAFYRERLGLRMGAPRRFGGYGNIFPRSARAGDGPLHVGEAAGLQDALFGFGIRSSILSGHYAARACLAGEPRLYDELCRQRLSGLHQMSIVNRLAYDCLGDGGYVWLLRDVERMGDLRGWLRRHYTCRPLMKVFSPVAQRLHGWLLHAAR